MNVYFHPSQWLHHERAEKIHMREVFHNEVFWIVMVTLLVLAGATVMMLLFGKTPTTPYLPAFPY